jgi:methionyl-tRNA formyltransferase
MLHKPLRLVFMGCPDFAVPALQKLSEDPDFTVAAVYCMPDRPKGRGKKPAPTPVKTFAASKGFAIETPASFRQNPEAIDRLKAYEPDFLVVVAYGLILPESVLAIPAIAPVNLHASLLPDFRGPAPIHQALLNGLSETGNTVMLMSKGMDEGDMLSWQKTAISPDDDLASLHDRLSLNGADLLCQTLKDYAAGRIRPVAQNHERATYTSKITPQMARIDWYKPAPEICNLIRAMSPAPGAWFADGDERIKVFRAAESCRTDAPPGTVIDQSLQSGIRIACGNDSSITLLELQRAGKSRIPAADFLRGCKLKSAVLACEIINNT